MVLVLTGDVSVVEKRQGTVHRVTFQRWLRNSTNGERPKGERFSRRRARFRLHDSPSLSGDKMNGLVKLGGRSEATLLLTPLCHVYGRPGSSIFHTSPPELRSLIHTYRREVLRIVTD